MTTLDRQDYIDELRFNIQEQDSVKAGIILSHFQNVEENTRVRVVFELSRANDNFAIPLLEQLIAEHPEVIDAIPALRDVFISKISEKPTVLARFLEADETYGNVDLHLVALDLLVATQDLRAAEKLATALAFPDARVRKQARARFVDLGAEAMPVLVQNLGSTDSDLLVQTLDTLGLIGAEAAVAPVRKLLHASPQNPNVRFAAYEALGKLPVRKGALMLAAGLEDPEDAVAMAATKAIDRNLDDYPVEGLRNLVREAEEQTERLVRIIIDSESTRVFLSLIGEAGFREYAIRHLTGRVSEEVRSYFEAQLREHSFQEYADALRPEQEPETSAQKLRVWAVDDSKMILHMYRTVFHNLGYEAQLFVSPAEAWEQIQQARPDILITDLNMPEMSGTELTEKVRELYDKEALPIVMVTSQEEAQDHQAAYASGVDSILSKPFSEKSVNTAITELLNT